MPPAIDLSQQLNSQQLSAVTHNQGPLLVLAGAGSGKTRTLIYRTANLIHQGADPNSILLLTFTNKAASQMQERLETLVGTTLPFAGTFHRFCAKLLRREAHHLRLSPDYLIYDDTDQLDLIKHLLRQLDLSPKEFRPRTVLSQISQAKNELLTPADYQTIAYGHFQTTIATLYTHYQRHLQEISALDFDDLLNYTVRLLLDVPPVRLRYQSRFAHVLVDEYQDTNKAQYLIIKTIAQEHRRLTVVGDASQSIYRWRGADSRNLNFLETDFPELTTIKLERNYRSTQPILDAAHAVISHNKTHPILSLWTDQTDGDPLHLFVAEDEKHEASFVLSALRHHLDSSSAVLYRTNAQSRAFEEACIRAGIPYVLVGGVKFYQRKEIKDILAYLRLLINPSDTVSLNRAQALGKRRLLSFQTKLSSLDLKKLTSTQIFDQVLEATNYLDRFDPKDEADLSRLENVQELRSVSTQFESLSDFLESVSLVENNTQSYDQNHRPTDAPISAPLTLMTMHSAKGLEFDQVFVVGLEEGLFPHSRSLLEPHELEEERRLCYVALTRARRHLYLTYAKNRLYFGGRGSNLASRFLSEIPPHLLRPFTHPNSNLNDSLLDQFLNDEIDIDQLLG